MLVRVLLVAAALICGSTALSDAQLLDVVAAHGKTNVQFAELEAAILNANEDSTEKSGRSAMAEVVAMVDMMIIQTNNEIAVLNTAHKKTQISCKKNLAKYALIIANNQRKQDRELAAAMEKRRNWEVKLPITPQLQAQIRKTVQHIKKEENTLAGAVELRRKKHAAYLKALDEHDLALRDVAAIRKIIQNSKLDGRSHKSAKVEGANSGKRAGAAKTTALLEYKGQAHSRLHNVIDLALTAVSKNAGIDLIYKLLYQTRDQLNLSRNKLIKGEQASVAVWRTNKLAFRADINQLRITTATLYQRIGTTKMQIGQSKKIEGQHKISMGQAKKTKDLHQILTDFLKVACKEDRDIYDTNIALKTNERTALIKVQKKLVTLKWSKKVYKSIKKVSEGIIYLKGHYNIRSALNRYLAVKKDGSIAFLSSRKNSAQKLLFKLNEDDLTYGIILQSGKKKKTFLTETGSNKVVFGKSGFSKHARWRMKFDATSKKLLIRNKATKNTLFVDATAGWSLNTISQTKDSRSEFNVERPGYKQIGCFKNKVGKQLQQYLGASNTMNTGSCFKKCQTAAAKKKFKFTYFGLSEGKQCFCGSVFDKNKAPFTDCGFLCNGRDGDLCGGNFRTIIYKVET